MKKGAILAVVGLILYALPLAGLPIVASAGSAPTAPSSPASAAIRTSHLRGSPASGTTATVGSVRREATARATATPTANYQPSEAPVPAGAQANPNGLLYNVKCVNAGWCVAVGQYNTSAGAVQPLLDLLSHGAWTASQPPLPAGANTGNPDAALFGVSCPTIAFCMADGDYIDSGGAIQGVFETWNGATWTASKAPLPGNAATSGFVAAMDDVACLSATSCVAAAQYTDTSGHLQGLAETWNGASWSPTELPTPSNAAANPFEFLLGISCPAAGTCYAGGGYNDASNNAQSLLARLSGGTWTVMEAPLPATGNTLSQINYLWCATVSFCAAAGFYTIGGSDFGLIETWNGTGWTATQAPLPSDAAANPQSGLIGAYCAGVGSCVLVGSYTDTGGNTHDIFETLASGTWAAALAPLPANANSNQQPLNVGGLTESLDGVGCTSTTNCLAVGTYKDMSNNFQALIEQELPPSTVGAYVPASPFRAFDSRSGSCVQCTLSGAFGPGQSRTIPITGNPSGNGTVPANAIAVVLNLTGVLGTQNTFLSVSPAGTPVGSTSNLNIDAGAIQANLVTVAIGTGGAVVVYNSVGAINALLDVEGYFVPLTVPLGSSPPGTFHAIAPQRVCDTRGGSGSPCASGVNDNQLGAGQSRLISVTGTNGVPADGSAAAAVFNLTAVLGSAGTFLTAYPPSSGGTCATPSTSNLNVSSGGILPNRVVVPISSSGKVCIYNAQGSINFIIDTNGWFGTGSEANVGALFYPVAPQRICDTRSGNSTTCSGRSISAAATLVTGGIGTASGDPSSPIAVMVNTTGILGTANTFMSVFPDGARPSPLTSDLNPSAGEIIANLVVVGVGNAGNIDVYNDQGKIDCALDAEGWFA